MRIVIIASAILALTVNVFADIIFTDSTFSDLDWTDLKIADNTPGQNGSYTAQHVATGGNPGAHRGFSHSWTGPGAIYVAHIKTGAEYDPSTQGAIQSMSYSLDAAWFSTNDHNAVAYSLLVIQDGFYYWAPHVQLTFPPDPQNTWINLGISDISESAFQGLSPNGPDTSTPDFSNSGGVIQLGIVTENGSQGVDPLVVSAGVDNWHVTVTNPTVIPTLSEWGMLIMGLLLLAAGTIAVIRRRKAALRNSL